LWSLVQIGGQLIGRSASERRHECLFHKGFRIAHRIGRRAAIAIENTLRLKPPAEPEGNQYPIRSAVDLPIAGCKSIDPGYDPAPCSSLVISRADTSIRKPNLIVIMAVDTSEMNWYSESYPRREGIVGHARKWANVSDKQCGGSRLFQAQTTVGSV
jgi:hypothetical protein